MNSEIPKKEVISRSGTFPFSATMGYRDLLFISGTVGRDSVTGEIASGDIAAQTRQTLENLKKQLDLAGSSLDKVLKTTVFLIDMDKFGMMNEAYRSYFPVDPPARSTVGVSALPDKECLVEIELIAYR